MWGMNGFMHNATNVKMMQVFSLSTPNSRYRVFKGILMFLNCRILNILFCVTISGF